MAKPPTRSDRQSGSDTPSAAQPSNELLSVQDSRIREKVEEVIGPLLGGGSQRVQVIERVTTLVSAEVFRGPIPHPQHLEAYEAVCPGAAHRIMRMAEIAQEKREDRRDVVIRREYDDRRLGMVLGFSALALLLVAGVIITALGEHTIGAGLLTAAVLGTVAGAFIHGRRPDMNNAKPTAKPSETPAPG
jgi:uncharacterized membrane protein